jgi:hypothetical protein
MDARTGFTAWLGIVSLSAACGPIPAPQDIKVTQGKQLLWSSATPGPFAAWEPADLTPLPGMGLPEQYPSWFVVEFNGHPAASSFPFNDGGPPLVLRTTPQLYLFTRNPQEFYETLTGMTVDRWTTEVHTPRLGPDISGAPPYHLPAALVMSDVRDQTMYTPLLPYWFWTTSPAIHTNPAAWLGIGSDPDGTGSIKGMRLITLPKCSTAINLQNTLEEMKASLTQLTQGAACTRGQLVDVKTDLLDFTAVTYFAHEAPPGGVRTPTTGLREGLLVSGRVHAQISSDLINSSCDVDFAYDYTWTLVNGFLTVSPRRLLLDAADPTTDACTGVLGYDGALTRLANALEVTLPAEVYKKAVDRQQFPPVEAANVAPFNTADWSCRYGPAGVTEPTECQSARASLRIAALSGVTQLRADLTQAETDALVNTIGDPSRWRCRPPTKQELANDCAASRPVRGRCQFTVPAVGVVAEPDQLRVAPFWEPNDTAQPGTALFYASFATGSRTAFRSLCTEPRGTGYGGDPVSFAGITPAPLICTWPAQQKLSDGPDSLVPGNHLVCPCTTSDDCALGDRCISELGSAARFCEQSCLRDDQCNTGSCDQRQLLCAGQRCSSDANCPLWLPKCQGADVGSPGTCVARP